MTAIIRPARIQDADAIARVLVDAWKWAYSSFMSPEFMAPRCDYATRAERLSSAWQAHGRIWVAVDEEQRVVGMASEHVPPQLAAYDCEIGALYVHPSAARSGFGRALVKTLVEEFVAQGARSMAIHTLVQNVIGCSFYERIGGVRDGSDEWNGFEGVWFVWRDLPALLRTL